MTLPWNTLETSAQLGEAFPEASEFLNSGSRSSDHQRVEKSMFRADSRGGGRWIRHRRNRQICQEFKPLFDFGVPGGLRSRLRHKVDTSRCVNTEARAFPTRRGDEQERRRRGRKTVGVPPMMTFPVVCFREIMENRLPDAHLKGKKPASSYPATFLCRTGIRE